MSPKKSSDSSEEEQPSTQPPSTEPPPSSPPPPNDNKQNRPPMDSHGVPITSPTVFPYKSGTARSYGSYRTNNGSQNQDGNAVICYVLLGAIGLGLLAFIIYEFETMHDRHYAMAEERLKEAIGMFPKNPKEYNLRETQKFADQFWRRYNFRAIGITCACVLTAFLLVRWHRNKTVMLHRRKTWFFWAYTVGAGFLALGWGAFLMRAPSKPTKLIKIIQRNPNARAWIYLAMIVFAGVLLYKYRSQKRFRTKGHHRRQKQTSVVMNVL